MVARMLPGENVVFRVGHQAHHIARRVAQRGDVGRGAVRIEGVGDCGLRIADCGLVEQVGVVEGDEVLGC